MEQLQEQISVQQSHKPFKMYKSKKGVSPLIATVLLIGFTMAIGGTLFAYMRSTAEKTIESTSSGLSTSVDCEEVFISLSKSTDGTDNFVSVLNDGEKDLSGFYYLEDGARLSGKDYTSTPISAFGSEVVTVSTITPPKTKILISVIPRIKVDNKIVDCGKQEKTIIITKL